MRNLYKEYAVRTLTIFLFASLTFEGRYVWAQVKVGENPQAINAGSVFEIESTNKGFLLPRLSLDNTQTWQLEGAPIAGMQVFNTNPNMFTEVSNYPVIPGGVGVYYWDGSGWVPQKFSAGSYDWLRVNDGNFPSNPADIANAIYHGGPESQEVVVRTETAGFNTSAKLTTIHGFGSLPTPIVANMFSEQSFTTGRASGLQTLSPDPLVFRTTDDNKILRERMRIGSNGGVGIGTTEPSPSAALHVSGRFLWTSSSTMEGSSNGAIMESGTLRVVHKSNGKFPTLMLADDFDEYPNSGKISFIRNIIPGGAMVLAVNTKNNGTGDTRAITIANSTGRVAIGEVENGPQYELDVLGDINASGEVRNSGMALSSDKRLKTDIKPVRDGLEIVSKLNPVSYRKKESIASEDYKKSEIGFIAQEVREILPQLIREGKDADKTLAMDYNSLIPVLTKAIQEQQALIEELSAERDNQSARLDAQSTEIAEIRHLLKNRSEESSIGIYRSTKGSTKINNSTK